MGPGQPQALDGRPEAGVTLADPHGCERRGSSGHVELSTIRRTLIPHQPLPTLYGRVGLGGDRVGRGCRPLALQCGKPTSTFLSMFRRKPQEQTPNTVLHELVDRVYDIRARVVALETEWADAQKRLMKVALRAEEAKRRLDKKRDEETDHREAFDRVEPAHSPQLPMDPYSRKMAQIKAQIGGYDASRSPANGNDDNGVPG